jgi:hypothetical protein
MTSFALVVFLWAQGVAAPPPALPVPPWHEGVAEEDKARAREALEEGHLLMEHGLFRLALNAYDAGLARWDHPGLHFSRARALWALRRPAEALHALWDARRYGGEGLDPNVLHVAVGIEKALTRHVLALLVMDGFPAGEVSLGGRRHEATAGHWEIVVAAGTHELIGPGGTKLVLVAGAGERVHVIASPSGVPRVFMRPLARADLDAHTARLPRPPREIEAPGPETVRPSSRGWMEFAHLKEPLARSEELAAVCRVAGGRAARLCEEHAAALEDLERGISRGLEMLSLLERKIAAITAGGLIDHLP